MKNIRREDYINQKDYNECLKKGWTAGYYEGERCLFNSKTIIIYRKMPKPLNYNIVV